MSERAWVTLAFAVVLSLTAARIFVLAITPTDLFVDEAQYWLWGQNLDFGYYSKPPMIGWVIRAFTGFGPVDPFWVRLPAPIFHAITAGLLGWLGKYLWDRKTGAVISVVYITLPFVGVGSFLISTDTIMFPFLLAALTAFLVAAKTQSIFWAMASGAALGAAALSKYAAFYFVPCAIIAMLIYPQIRLTWQQVSALIAALLVAFSPNLIWNIANGFSTAQHTLDNADWVRDPSQRAGLNVDKLAEFFFAQAIVVGPTIFLLLGWLTWLGLKQNLQARESVLLLFCIPIVATVCVQATLSEAYANWAVSAYLAGTLLVGCFLATRPRWLFTTLAINGAFAAVLLVAVSLADRLTLGSDRLLLARYVGIDAMGQSILDSANGKPIVASNRDILANLFFIKPADQAVFATPPRGRPKHHYQLKFPYDGENEEVVLVHRAQDELQCAQRSRLKTLAPGSGHYTGQTFELSLVPSACVTQ